MSNRIPSKSLLVDLYHYGMQSGAKKASFATFSGEGELYGQFVRKNPSEYSPDLLMLSLSPAQPTNPRDFACRKETHFCSN